MGSRPEQPLYASAEPDVAPGGAGRRSAGRRRAAQPRRARWIGVAALCASLGAALWLAAPALAQPPDGPVQVASLEAAGLPTLAVGAEGQATLAWLTGDLDEPPTLWLAQGPLWQPEPLALADQERGATDLVSRIGERLTLAYAYPATGTQMIQRITWNAPLVAPIELPDHAPWAYALDERGALALAWAEEGLLTVWRESTGITQTAPLPPQTAATALQLVVDDAGGAHLAWEASGPADEAGIYYLALQDPQSAPARVAPQGRDVALRVGPDGRVHLAWMRDGTLYYAHSGDWSTARAVATLAGPTSAYALATGPDGMAHLLWVSDEQIWYANAADWEGSRLAVAAGRAIDFLATATDDRGRVHLAWVEREPERRLAYLRLFDPPPQLAVTYPLGGELLAADSEARALTNLPPGELARVEFYLEQEPEPAALSALIALDVDVDGGDGWSAPLPLAGLDPQARYRVMALGVMRQGEMLRATGDWFALASPSHFPLWLYGVAEAPAELEARAVSLWSPSDAPWPTRVDLYAWPVASACLAAGHCAAADPEPLPSATPHHLGTYAPQRPARQASGVEARLTFATTALPEGAYMLTARLEDAEGRSAWVRVHEVWQVRRTRRATIQMLAPTGATVSGGRVVLAARTNDPQGQVRRVDFYLAREGLADPLAASDLLWVASDNDGLDGWLANLMVSDFWLGGPWVAWAMAYDAHGLADSARSAQPFMILGAAHAAVQWLAPLGDRPLAGVEPIVVTTPARGPTPRAISAYLAFESALQPLGALALTSGGWQLDWDTRLLDDGDYRLAVIVEHADGRRDTYHSPSLRVANAAAGLRWASPSAGEALVGGKILSITSTGEGAGSPSPVQAYLRDGDGRLLPIAALFPAEGGWRGVWDSHGILDGAYTLVAWVPRLDGGLARLEQAITVRNETPHIALETARAVWSGTQRLYWRATSPMGRPLRVTAAYSPDAGRHWVTLAENVAAGESLLWNTRAVPDAAQGRLRLTVCDDRLCSRSDDIPVVVDNVNRAPAVALLDPAEGALHRQELRIAWACWDADGDALTVDLAFRRGQGLWQTLLSGAPDEGSYWWDARAWPAGDDYTLRLTVRDGRGGQAVAMRSGIALTANTPPSAQVVWPNQGARLVDEVAILYHASDRDRDPLTIDLYYSDNGGQTWLPLAAGLENTGYYVWQIAFLPSGAQYRVRVVARDGVSQAMGESDGVFTIGRESPLQVSLWSPQGGERLSGLQAVRWSVHDAERRALRAEVSARFAGATLWWPLASDLPNDGLYLWDTNALPDGVYLLRVTVSDGAASASAITTSAVGVHNHENRPPQVSLLSPLGGEAWAGWREIAWRASDADGDALTATVSVSWDGGDWRDLAQVDARVGAALWDTSAWPSGQRYRVRVTVTDGQETAEARSPGLLTLANRRATPPHIAALAWQETGALASGGLVTWLAEDAEGDLLTLEVAQSDDEGATWRRLVSGLANTGEYSMEADLSTERPLYLRLIADDGLYRSQATIAVAPPALAEAQRPALRILEPADDVSAAWSGAQTIRWQASDPLGQGLTIQVAASADGGLTWRSLGIDLPNTGSLAWDTTTMPNGIYRLRVIARNGRYAITQLSAPFEIANKGRNPPVITLLSPRGGEAWSGMQEIVWRASDADDDALTLLLSYSTDRGARWAPLMPPLIEATGGVRSAVCDTMALPNAEELWISASVDDGLTTARAIVGPVAVRNAPNPAVQLTLETPARQWQGVQRLNWRTLHAAGRNPQVSLEVSYDGGAWRALETELPPLGSYAWNTVEAEGAWVRLRAVARDGPSQGMAVLWESILVRGNLAPIWRPFYPR